MKRNCQSVLIWAGILLALVSGVSISTADENSIRVYGVSTFSDLIQAVGKKFMTEHPDIQVKVRGTTSDFGFQALLNGETDLVMAARKPNAVERGLAERRHLKWAGVPVAWESVAIISHPGVSVLELTVDQLRKIYEGVYQNWRDLGTADLRIMLHSMAYPQDDIAVWFSNTVLARGEFGPGIVWVKAPEFLIQHVSVHSGSVGYVGNLQLTDYLKRNPQTEVRVLKIRAQAESPALGPSGEIRKKGEYPFTIPLFLFWNENNPDPRIEQFVRYCKDKLGEPVER